MLRHLGDDLRPSSTVRQKGIMSFRFVSPISSRTFFIARHSSAKPRDSARRNSASAAEAEHRVLLRRLVAPAADQVGVFVGLEVAQPDDHVLGVKRRGDHRDALCQLVHEELRLVVVAGGQPVDLGVDCRIVELGVVEQGQRMDLDVVGDDEFLAGQADAVIGNEREAEGLLRVGHVRRGWYTVAAGPSDSSAAPKS